MPLWHLTLMMALYHPSQSGRPSLHPADPEAEVAKDLESALAQTVVWFVHNDSPEWCDLTAADFSRMRRKVVVDGRRIQGREAMEGVELGAGMRMLPNQE